MSAGQHVAGELDALELQPEQAGQHMGEGGLADAGDVLDQQVATGEHAGQGEAYMAWSLPRMMRLAESMRRRAM